MSDLLGRIPARSQRVQWREFGSEAILLDPSTGEFAQINEIGAAIWRFIDGKRTVGDIADALLDEFDALPADVARDVQAFITELSATSLLSLAS